MCTIVSSLLFPQDLVLPVISFPYIFKLSSGSFPGDLKHAKVVPSLRTKSEATSTDLLNLSLVAPFLLPSQASQGIIYNLSLISHFLLFNPLKSRFYSALPLSPATEALCKGRYFISNCQVQ